MQEEAAAKREAADLRQRLAEARLEASRARDEATALEKAVAMARTEAVTAQVQLREQEGAARDAASRAAGQLAEARAAWQRSDKEAVALREKLAVQAECGGAHGGGSGDGDESWEGE